jgi:hypothetical protein
MSDADADHVLRTLAQAPNRTLQSVEKPATSVSWSDNSPLGMDEPTRDVFFLYKIVIKVTVMYQGVTA